MNKNQNNKKMYQEEQPLDDYEKELEAFLSKGEFVSDPHFKETKKTLEEAAKRHIDLQQTKSITLRVKKEDLMKVKAKAERSGIAYQTLIGLLIHQYLTGELKIIL